MKIFFCAKKIKMKEIYKIIILSNKILYKVLNYLSIYIVLRLK